MPTADTPPVSTQVLPPVRRVVRRLRRRGRGVVAYLSVMGPGLITASAGNDAGGIATYAQAGAVYGFHLLWVLSILTVSLIVVQEMCARMGAITGKGLSDLIREEFDIRWTAVAILSLFIANSAITISEFVGVAGAAQVFGLPSWLVVPLVAAGLWWLVTRRSYSTAERVFLGLAMIFLTYVPAAILAKPHWDAVASSLITPNLSGVGAISMVVSLIGTTISPYMQLFVQSSVVEKGITAKDYRLARADVVSSSIFAILIAGFIIVATGATLYVHKVGVNYASASASDFAVALEPFLHQSARLLFGMGLLGASLLAAAVLPLSTSYAVCETLGVESGLSRSFRQAPVFYGLFTGMIAVGAVIASFVPEAQIVPLLIGLQTLNGVLLPILLVFILVLINRKDLMGAYVNGRIYNGIALLTTVVVGTLSLLIVAGTFLHIGPAA